MRLLGRIISRLIAAFFGYAAASLAAGLTLVVAIIAANPFGFADEAPGPAVMRIVFMGGMFGAFISVLAFAPALVAVLVAELFALRRLFYYLFAGGLTGALGYVGFTDFGLRPDAPSGAGDELLLIVAAGLIAGFAYWLVAGRAAGIFARPVA